MVELPLPGIGSFQKTKGTGCFQSDLTNNDSIWSSTGQSFPNLDNSINVFFGFLQARLIKR